MSISADISKIEARIQKLERAFNMYFTGQDRRPPIKELNQLRKEIDRIMDRIDLTNNSAAKFRLQTLVHTFTTYRMKWEKGVKDIEEGRARPGLHFFGGLGMRHTEMLRAEKKKKEPAASMVDEKVSDAAKKYVELAKNHTGKVYDPALVEMKLRKKLEQIKEKHGDKFSFNVYFDGKSVRIKTESKDKKDE